MKWSSILTKSTWSTLPKIILPSSSALPIETSNSAVKKAKTPSIEVKDTSYGKVLDLFVLVAHMLTGYSQSGTIQSCYRPFNRTPRWDCCEFEISYGRTVDLFVRVASLPTGYSQSRVIQSRHKLFNRSSQPSPCKRETSLILSPPILPISHFHNCRQFRSAMQDLPPTTLNHEAASDGIYFFS